MDAEALERLHDVRCRLQQIGIFDTRWQRAIEVFDALGYTIVPIAEVEAGRALYEAIYKGGDVSLVATAHVEAYKAVLDAQ